MSKIKIITDSASDIPPHLIDELQIGIVPLTITFGDKSYKDVIELSVEEFWEKSQSSPTLPQTAAPSIAAFVEAMTEAIESGYDGIIVITLSSKLSATYQSATRASEEVGQSKIPIIVIDSELATYGQGSLAVLGSENSSLPIEELATLIRNTKARTRVFGALDTLDNLRKGGRIGPAAATLGSILSVKPIIEVKDGVIEAPSKQRTRKRALEYLYDLVQGQADQIEKIAVISALAPDTDEFVAKIKEITKLKDIPVAIIGPVIGSHSGPRTIGVAFTLQEKAH
ncbi:MULTISPECIES: DegV family protein [Acidithrix]|uniref:DegV domain-containing protein n=1 Tax=Acidithrix ferrooxidans TaxID=1280514 RepID=A0A0D8HFL6_9ACTN|nr:MULTISPECIES: DegV family protein [Acidithrix]KJF16760.1 DegV domain-containing protein [Acidithrix ferrooxidans]CAG4934510.1 unnamed protein product [Acidithrix sp. C25]